MRMSDERAPGEPRPCSACGRKILFKKGPNGAWIPLELVRNVYTREGEDQCVPLAPPLGKELFVSHYVTCTNPERFRKRDRSQDPHP